MADAPADPIAAWAAADPDAVAVVEGAVTTTRSELNAEINRVSSGLAALGIKAGERGVWCGPNSTEVVVFMHACRKLGLVAVPLPYRFTAEECHHVLSDSDAAVVMVDAAYAPTIAGLVPRLPHLRLALSFRGTCPGMRPVEEVKALGAPGEPPPKADYGTAMMYTSGTTGRPKGAIRSRSDRPLLGAMMAALNFGSSEVHLVTGPLYHAGPNAFALLTHITGGTLVVMRSFDPAEWVRLVGEHRVTSAFVTPTHLKRIVALPDALLAAADLSSLRTVIANAAPVPYALKQEVVAKLGDGFLYEVYGSTELGIATVLRPEDQLRKPGSCGRPYGGIELKVVGDDGTERPAGEAGELFVRTALAIDGYHRMAEQMPELPGDEGWKSVGDVAWLDDEGYLYICDRKTDMIITGGMNVYPAEVEAALHAHADVADAAVIGLPDDEWGERVHAVVVAKPGRQLDPSALDAFLAGRLARFKRPRSWDFRPELPRTESGKLLKRVLRAEYREGQPSQV
ncbi:MAG TPA: AMP-binding protein [Acidimicrobiales bacterium]|nr:AMP-binding protein [Acidimicrobiales bacterium]